MSDVDMFREEFLVRVVQGVGTRVEGRVVQVVAVSHERVGTAVHRVDD